MKPGFSMRLLTSVVAAAALTLAGSVWAHGDAALASKVTPHGGQQRAAGPYHLELVVSEAHIVVYVTDHADVAQPTAGWGGSAAVLSGGSKQQIELKPVADNRLEGSAPSALAAGAKLVISVRDARQQQEQTRFVLPERH
jgi:hypothetical protein